MEAKWPFFVILIFFLFLTGYLISHLERSKVMSQWDKRRCDFSVMVAARFFKPEEDPRSPSEFSTENFEFCTKQYANAFMETFMAPVTHLMGKQAGLAGGAMGALGQVREITQRVYTAFTSYLASFFGKYQRAIGEFRRIIIYLRMGVQRMVAIALSTIYMGMTIFRGMLNAIQTVIRVVLIVCAIMLAVIIILWFVLFPVIPIVMTALTAVIALVGALSVVMSSSIASDAESKKGGFCFAERTPIVVLTATGEALQKQVKDVRVGDRLQDGGQVTARMEMVSDGIEWYSVEGIQVSGDHLLQGTDGQWRPVKEDPRACPLSEPFAASPRVYCFNTTTHTIPLRGLYTTLCFRDWEELEEDDDEGHRLWREMVLRMLDPQAKAGHDTEMDIPLWGGDTEVLTETGRRLIRSFVTGDTILDGRGQVQEVLGVIQGITSVGTEETVATSEWNTSRYEWKEETQEWVAWQTPVPLYGKRGWHLITSSGEFVVYSGASESTEVNMRIRDFTEVGYTRLAEMCPFVLRRLTPDKR